jgi:hypothetical protein
MSEMQRSMQAATAGYTPPLLRADSNLGKPAAGAGNANYPGAAARPTGSAVPIPIPTGSALPPAPATSSAAVMEDIDITEMPWFENERAGSLGLEDYDAIQRQLLDRPNYLLQRLGKAGAATSTNRGADTSAQVSTSVDSTNSATVSTTGTNRKEDPELAIPFLLDEQSATSTSTNASSHITVTTAAVEKSAALEDDVDVGLGLDIECDRPIGGTPPGATASAAAGRAAMPYAETPPCREIHSASYLVHVGLLPDDSAAGASAIGKEKPGPFPIPVHTGSASISNNVITTSTSTSTATLTCSELTAQLQQVEHVVIEKEEEGVVEEEEEEELPPEVPYYTFVKF